MTDTKTIRAWKGFDFSLSCRGHQFEVGKSYSIDGVPIACESVFHACMSPLDVLDYYSGRSSRYAEVELSGKTA